MIACNYSESCKTATKGSLAYVMGINPGWDNNRIPILSRSRGGRWIWKWESLKRLCNFRLKTIPPEHPRYQVLGFAPGSDSLNDILESAQRLLKTA